MGVIDQMRDEFLAEAGDLLEEINADLLALEERGADVGRDLLQKVLRAAHSLKGSSGMFGYEDLSQASHSLEGMLENLREGHVEDAESMLEATLDQLEVMRHLLREITDPEQDDLESGSAAGAGGASGPAKLEAQAVCHEPTFPDPNQQFLRVELGKMDGALNLVGDLFLGIALLRDLQRAMRRGPARRRLYRRQVEETRLMARRLSELRENLLSMRMVPLGKIFSRLVPAVRSVTRARGKKAQLTITGGETRLDKAMAERLADPLLHLIRNAIDHGLEEPRVRVGLGKPTEGRVSLSARREGPEVVVEVSDDGRGVDLDKVRTKAQSMGLLPRDADPSERQILECMFMPGFSTAGKVDSVSGRGVGMDVVRFNVARLSGTVDIHTERGRGTTVSIRVPPTLSTIEGLLVEIGSQAFVFPFHSVVEVLRVTESARRQALGDGVLTLRERQMPALSLGPLFGLNGQDREPRFAVVVGRPGDERALLVDAVGERSEVLVKPLGPRLDSVPGLSGVAELADGRVALVLDVSSVTEGAVSVDGPANQP